MTVQVLDLAPMLAFSWNYFRPSGDVRLVKEDVSVNYEGICDDFVSLKMMCRLNLWKVSIGYDVHACVQKDECIYVYMSVYAYTVFNKEIFNCCDTRNG